MVTGWAEYRSRGRTGIRRCYGADDSRSVQAVSLAGTGSVSDVGVSTRAVAPIGPGASTPSSASNVTTARPPAGSGSTAQTARPPISPHVPAVVARETGSGSRPSEVETVSVAGRVWSSGPALETSTDTVTVPPAAAVVATSAL